MRAASWLPVLLAVATASAAPPGLLDEPLPEDPLQVTVHRLSNGLTVYLSPNPGQPRISEALVVRAGRRDDPPEAPGLSHVVEHMMFMGTERMGTLDFAREWPKLERILALSEELDRGPDAATAAALKGRLDAEYVSAARDEIPNELSAVYSQLGVQGLNAFTGNDETVYLADFPADRAEAWARVESDRFAHPVFRALPQELAVVDEEIDMRRGDSAGGGILAAVSARLFEGHSYARSLTAAGRPPADLRLPALRRFRERYYVPGNAALVLSGDFDRARMLALVARTFGAWAPGGGAPRPAGAVPRGPRGEVGVEAREPRGEEVLISWLTVPEGHPDAPALRLAARLLTDNEGILAGERRRAPDIQNAGAAASFFRDGGDFRLWAVARRYGQHARERDFLLAAVDDLREGRFSKEEFAAAKAASAAGRVWSRRDNGMRAREIAETFSRGEPWASVVRRERRADALSREQVVRAARRYLGEDRVVGRLRRGPAGKTPTPRRSFTPARSAAEARSAFAAEVLAMPREDRVPRFLVAGRDYTVLRSTAGDVFAAPNPSDDLYTLTLSLEVGARADRRFCAAVNLLHAADGGGPWRRLRALGASFSADCGEWTTTLSLNGFERDLVPELAAYRDLLLGGDLGEGSLKAAADRMASSRAAAEAGPSRRFERLAAYARREADSPLLCDIGPDALRALRVETVRGFGLRLLKAPWRAGYVGRRRAAEVAAALSGWRAAPAEASLRDRPARLIRPSEPRIYLMSGEGTESLIGAYVADGPAPPAEAIEQFVWSSYLGRGQDSLLPQELRQTRALSYTVSAGYRSGEHADDDGDLWVELSARGDKTVETVALLERLLSDPPMTEARFQATKTALEEYYREQPVAFSETPQALMSWEDGGIAGDPRPGRYERLRRYTLDDMRAYSTRYRRRPPVFYVMGRDDPALRARLRQLGDLRVLPPSAAGAK